MRNEQFTYVIEFDFTPTDAAFESFEALRDELKENIKQSPESAIDELVANIGSENIIISIRDNRTNHIVTVWPHPLAWRRQ